VPSYLTAKVQLPDLQRNTAPFAIKKIHIAHGIIHKSKDFTSGSTDMPKSNLFFRRAAGVILLSAVSAVGVSHSATAATSCLSKPNRTASAGGHWYYRIDRATHRKCWYLKQAGAKQAGTRSRAAVKQEPTESAAAPASDAEGRPGLTSWFNSMLNAAKRPKPASAETGYDIEPVVSTPAAKPVEEARPSPAAKTFTRKVRRSRAHAVRHADKAENKAEEASAKNSENVQAKTSGQGQSESAAQAPAKLDESARTELFLEFLRWRGRQRTQQQ
jgi:hypothetical protein